MFTLLELYIQTEVLTSTVYHTGTIEFYRSVNQQSVPHWNYRGLQKY